MKNHTNPFEYEAASKFSPDELLEYYIEDFNYSRFISSKRNVFLFGERGTGKTMALLYYSLPVQLKKAEKFEHDLDISTISVYVPCNTPLTHRREFELLDDLQASICSEHFLVISIMYAVIETVSKIEGIADNSDFSDFVKELKYVLDLDMPEPIDSLSKFCIALNRTNLSVQRALDYKTLNLESSELFSYGIRM